MLSGGVRFVISHLTLVIDSSFTTSAFVIRAWKSFLLNR
jgi:hypothetical protein